MPISSNFKAIFVHIPKCAGTSIEKYLGMGDVTQLYSHKPIKNCGLSYDKTLFTARELIEFENVTPQHLPLKYLTRILPKKVINTYYKFTVVRNPYERVISEFAYIHDNPSERTKEFRNRPFDEFVDAVLALPAEQRLILFDSHLSSQISFVVDDYYKIGVNQVFKMENLEECANKMQELTGLSIPFPHSRKSSFGEDTVQPTRKTKDKIYNFFKEDFIFFGYDK